MNTLIDQAERDRFIFEQGKNISVIAPAGVGKTRSIVERIVNLARLPEDEAVDRLSRLIVVTYSVRAAQQMQQRARIALREEKVSARVQRAFQQTFFGTIHSYCVKLLDRFGHYLGLPSSVTLLQDDGELWNRFLIRGLGQGSDFHADLHELFHFYAPEKLYALGKEISPGIPGQVGPLPVLDLRRLLDYRDNALHAATKKSIARAQEAAQRWGEAWVRGDRHWSLPKCPESDKAADFAKIWATTFSPLHRWLGEAALAFGRHVANAYESFRLSEAVMTYDDQVRMALRVLEFPAVQKELATERLSVLLDEAQDTDPKQFEVLLCVAGLRGNPVQAVDQSFCIVGDFQQAIYAPRSDLSVYRRIHDEISAEPRGASSRLQVTFRCDRAIIDFANRTFPEVLNDANGQCAFVELVPREEAGSGQVVRWACPVMPEEAVGKKISAEVRAGHEARYVAKRLLELGPSGLGVGSWAQVAVLCPRKNWLLDIQRELAALDLPTQLHSSNEQQGDRTPGAWLTALIWIAAHPEDSFEIAGVLREIFGVSDHDMAIFTAGNGDRLRLDRPAPKTSGPVETALQVLREACANSDAVPLHQSVQALVEKTHLRERLHTLPESEFEDGDHELDDLLATIAARGADGATLAELAQELRLGLTQVHPEEEEVRDAIQLLTSHKAKGLEWQAVVVPYLFRAIESKSATYPRLVQIGDGEIICRDKADFAANALDFVETRERQQLQRLLYVMCTRARQTLLFIDDEALYAERKRRTGWSAGDLLGWTNGQNREAWNDLPSTLSSSVAAASSPQSMPDDEPDIALPGLTSRHLKDAISHAMDIPRRITPHALAVHRSHEIDAEPEKRAESTDTSALSTNPGVLYGTWWHEFVETIPWHQPVESWHKKFLEALPRSPQPGRSTREWELFRTSELAQWLAQPGRAVQVEIPFLWHDADRSCLEGVMDLAIYSSNESTWRVIDWKTNQIGPDGAAGLANVYRGQIHAYVQALRGMLAGEVRGSLYLTQTGEWIEL